MDWYNTFHARGGVRTVIGQSGTITAERLSYDPATQFGARPLKRVIQNLVRTPLAEKLLSGEIPPRTSVYLRAFDGRVYFEVVQPVASAQ